MKRIDIFKLPLMFFFLILVAAGLIGSGTYSWANWKPATCMPDRCFCEAIRTGIVRQPANAWSSFAFVLVGFLVLGQAKYDRSGQSHISMVNPMTRRMVYGFLFGLSLILIGLGSAFYHASLTFIGQVFDVMGMYLLASFILIYNMCRGRNLNQAIVVIAFLSLNLSLAGLLIWYPEFRRYLFAIMIVLALIPEYLTRRRKKTTINWRFIVVSVLTLALAFFIWILDITKVLCRPYGVFQGHAIWHILGALSSGFLYLYYRSETVEA